MYRLITRCFHTQALPAKAVLQGGRLSIPSLTMNDVTAYVCYTDTVAGVGEASVDLLVIPGNIGHVHGQLNSSPELKFWSFESRVYFFWLMLIFSPQILLFCIWLFRCGYPLTILLVISYDSQILSLDSTCNNLW